MSGNDDRDAEAGFEVRLLEVRVDRARVRRLELGIGVDLLISRVDRAVQSGTVAGIAAVGDDGQLVLPGQVRQRDPPVRPHRRRIKRSPVERDLAHRLGDEVHVAGGARLSAAEPDDGRRLEYLATAGQVERHGVSVDGQQPGPLAGLGSGDLGDLH